MSRADMTSAYPQPPDGAAPGYDGVAKSLHWLILALLIAQFAIAWTMPDVRHDTKPVGLVGLHLSVGAVILVSAVIRLLWRIAHPVPLPSDIPRWQYHMARATHALLYLVAIVLPLMGWINASARGWTIRLFGTVALPALAPAGSSLGHAMGDIHTLTAYALLGLVGLHAAAALYHHFWRRDRVLLRMLPGA